MHVTPEQQRRKPLQLMHTRMQAAATPHRSAGMMQRYEESQNVNVKDPSCV